MALANELFEQDLLIAFPETSHTFLKDNFAAAESWLSLAQLAGTPNVYTLFYDIEPKSLVWYSAEQFEKEDYSIPETLEQLFSLSDRMISSAKAAWCVGFGSGDQTGWPAADWLEDIMLRLEPELYSDWTKNKIAFNDQRVNNAYDYLARFMIDAYLDEGLIGAFQTHFTESPLGLLGSEPDCFMHRQGSFLLNEIKEQAELNQDDRFEAFQNLDLFAFPSQTAQDKPMLVASKLWVQTKETAATQQFIRFLESQLFQELVMAQGIITAHKTANMALYPYELQRDAASLLLNATRVGLDASDQLANLVRIAFRTSVLDYLAGAQAWEVTFAVQQVWTKEKEKPFP